MHHSSAPSSLPLRWYIALHSLAFIVGLSLVFVALGFGAGLLGDAITGFASVSLFGYRLGINTLLRVIAGLMLIFFALVMLKCIPLPALQREARVHLSQKPQGYLGSVLVGLAFAAGWTPCIGPILGSILGIAAHGSSAAQGAWLLLSYTLGFAIPFLLAAQSLTLWQRLRRHVSIIERIGGVMLLLVGLMLVFDGTRWLVMQFPQVSFETHLASEGASPSLGIAFVAGMLSFLSPCVLPILPSFLAYLTGLSAQQLRETQRQGTA